MLGEVSLTDVEYNDWDLEFLFWPLEAALLRWQKEPLVP